MKTLGAPSVLTVFTQTSHATLSFHDIATCVYIPVVSPTSDVGQTHLNLVENIILIIILICKAHLSRSSHPSCFSCPAFFMFFSASISSFDLRPQTLMLFQIHGQPPSKLCDHVNTPCLPKTTDLLSYSSPTSVSSCCFFYIPAVMHTLLSPWISLSFIEFPSLILSGTMIHFHAELVALHSSCKQLLSALEEICFHAVAHNILKT